MISHESTKTRKRDRLFRAFVFSWLFLFAVPRIALACPVCFGETSSPLALAMNRGIWMMLGVVACVLGAFAYFFMYLMRRAKLAEALENRAAAARRADGSGYTTGEGIA